MRTRDLRLVPLAGAAWGAALLCVFVPAGAWLCAVLCTVGAAGAVVFVRRWRRSRASTAGLVGVVLAVCAAVCVAVGCASPARESAAAAGGRAVELTAGISSSASVGIRRVRCGSGDTRAVTPELNDDMRTSGLSHLTAVSGGIVCNRGGYSRRSRHHQARALHGRAPRGR